LSSELDELTEAVIARVNRTSALYQQFGFLADVLVVDGEEARYYEEVPVGHFAEGKLSDAEHAFVITLDEGHHLHPIVRHYRRGELVAAYHLTGNVENEWDKPDVHVKPLKKFLARRLAAAAV
jgi:hypothetical protein